MKMKINLMFYQRGESRPQALFLLVIVCAIIFYLFYTGEMNVGTHAVGEVAKSRVNVE